MKSRAFLRFPAASPSAKETVKKEERKCAIVSRLVVVSLMRSTRSSLDFVRRLHHSVYEFCNWPFETNGALGANHSFSFVLLSLSGFRLQRALASFSLV